MQKRAYSNPIKQYSAVFEPLPAKSDAVLYFDAHAVTLPYAEDFPKLHYHDRYEIGLCEGGEGLFLSERGAFSVAGGDLIFVAPGCRHYSRSLDRDALCRCRFVYLQADAVRTLLSIASKEETDALAEASSRIPCVIRVGAHADAAALLAEIVALCDAPTKNRDRLIVLRLATLLLDADRYFPNETVQNISEHISVGRMPATGAEQIAEYLSLHCHEPQSTKTLAKMCHLSESQLRRQFVSVYGIPPIAYRNRLRCRIAAELLRESTLSIAEISDQLGYTTPADLYRAFRLLYQCSPSEYRKQRKR